MANGTSFAEGKIHYYDDSIEKFQNLGELLELVYEREKEKSLIRQIEICGLDPKGGAIQAIFDFNSLSSGVTAPAKDEPPRFQRMLGEILLEDGIIDAAQLAQALEEQTQSHGEERLGKVLQRLGFTSAKEIYAALGKQYGISES